MRKGMEFLQDYSYAIAVLTVVGSSSLFILGCIVGLTGHFRKSVKLKGAAGNLIMVSFVLVFAGFIGLLFTGWVMSDLKNLS